MNHREEGEKSDEFQNRSEDEYIQEPDITY